MGMIGLERWLVLAAATATACGPAVAVTDDTSTSGTSADTTSAMSSVTPTTASTAMDISTTPDDDDDDVDDDDPPHFDDFGDVDIGGPGCGDMCSAVDVLFVVDNSGSMAEEQLELSRAAVRWIGALLGDGGSYDIQVMVTTTDMGNPLCTPFQPAGYEPAQGAPTATGCNSRIDDFTGLGSSPETSPEACTAVCPVDITPSDPFLAFDASGSNVPNVPDSDVDGDGVLDSPEAQALACLLPQGINGCGYESPLEAMLQALNPDASWNGGDRPFLRDDARLAIVVLTDESDCSVQDYSVMNDPTFFNINPANGEPQASSAICWNAGVTCNGPDAAGVYSDCQVVADGPLQETERYTTYLDYLVRSQGKVVDLFAIAGVPEVTEYSDRPPFAPTSGGIDDLVVRDWVDGVAPGGDILPGEQGVSVEEKHWLFGVGPACTGQNSQGDYTRQAVPNLRLFDVCTALDEADTQHCFIDSICDATYDNAMHTLYGTIFAQIGD